MDNRTLSPKNIEQMARIIHPGSWAVEGSRPLATLLGSCVAVCLFDPFSRVGGLNHFMLPTIRRSKSSPTDSLLSGSVAMEALLDALLQRGVSKANLQAKAFGGGSMYDTTGASMDIGLRNATFAKEWLSQEGIALQASDLLGPWSRKLLFLPDSGAAYCRRMAPISKAEERGPEEHE